MQEAPSSEGAFLVSATPPHREATGVGTGDGGGMLTGGGVGTGDGGGMLTGGGLRADNFPQYNYALVGLMVCQVVAFS